MIKVTLDTNIANDNDLVREGQKAGLEVLHTSVTDRELMGSSINPASADSPPILETVVLNESLLGQAVLGGPNEQGIFESLLKIISNGSFPSGPNRSNLSDGQKRQLRDAMILSTHIRESRDIFVTNDAHLIPNHNKPIWQLKSGMSIQCLGQLSQIFIILTGSVLASGLVFVCVWDCQA